MYHQLQHIGEEGLIAEIEYTIGDPEDDMPVIIKITIGDPEDDMPVIIKITIGDPEDDMPVIIKITIGETVIPVGAFDLSQIEDMSDKLLAGHEAVMQGLVDERLIERWKDNQDDR